MKKIHHIDPRVACRHSKTYKAKRPPKCGCVMCQLKWMGTQLAKTSEDVKYLLYKQDSEEWF